jgi:hypothetical protein
MFLESRLLIKAAFYVLNQYLYLIISPNYDQKSLVWNKLFIDVRILAINRLKFRFKLNHMNAYTP